MSSEILQTWFKKNFVPAELEYVQKKSFPQKVVKMLNNAHLHSEENIVKSHCDRVIGIFLPPNTSALIQPTWIKAQLKQ